MKRTAEEQKLFDELRAQARHGFSRDEIVWAEVERRLHPPAAVKEEKVKKEAEAPAPHKLKENLYLTRIFADVEIIIPATDGTETIVGARDVFQWIDSNFKKWGLDNTQPPTAETPLAVFEESKDGMFKDIYPAFDLDLNALCFTQSQIIATARMYKSRLHGGGGRNTFLFRGGDEFFVASVDPDSYRDFYVSVNRLGGDCVLDAGCRHRFFFPQRALNT